VASSTVLFVVRRVCASDDLIQSPEPPVVRIVIEVTTAGIEYQPYVSGVSFCPGAKTKRSQSVKSASHSLQFVAKFVDKLSITGIET
jgi:hypothetical protein